MFPYEVLLDICKFLPRAHLVSLQFVDRRLRKFVNDNSLYWPLHRCYRLTFLEFFALKTLCRADNLSDFPIELPPNLSARLASLRWPPAADGQIPLFLNETEPTFLLFEFVSGHKFFVQIGPFVTAQNAASLIFWLHQISEVFFEEEIRGMPKFCPRFLEWLNLNKLDQILRLRCKTFSCCDYEPFDQLDVQFNLKHLQTEIMDKANGTIFSDELLHLLFNGNPHIKAFSTRWVINCGDDFTDRLIEHAAKGLNAEKMVPSIRFVPSFHRQRELPIPTKSLTASEKVRLIRRETNDWRLEEWQIDNLHKEYIKFRVVLYIYNDAETGEEAISQFSVGVKGVLLCNGAFAAHTNLAIFDVDRNPGDSDDLLDKGRFVLDGTTRELSQIEPELRIIHDCADDIKPCHRLFVIKVPPEFIHSGRAHKIFDIGTLDLEKKRKDEQRTCQNNF
ncbi:hypothetical protein niasHS_002691 [Heterodera schachtii]|uniref:F-box domain-containing protein n=1 Tax=Heterodera schachtii TaxID=97005 RepID=A0ABD2K267_HETSC